MPRSATDYGLSALFTLVLTAALPASAAQWPSAPYLPLDMAQKAANAALTHCAAEGHRVSVAIVDRSGSIKVLLKADESGPHTVGSSQGKAFTAASMGRDTLGLADFMKDHPELDGLRDMDQRMVILGGGVAIKAGDTVIAGIGVGGAPSGKIDDDCARTGLATIVQ